ncbi:MAG: ribose-phosphate diphosphokinase [Euryarchaeota archaeon]|nr:ribose-phosphate diphosphokinase [Euryarchaeota archaeon]
MSSSAGAMHRARAVAQRVGAQFDYLEKRRISSEVVEMTPKNLDVRGKSVCILDDIISTGGTMAKALEQLKRNGAREVVAAAVHGLFIGDAAEKLKRAGARDVFATNTVESAFSRVSVAESIVQALSLKATAPGAR